MSEEDLIANDSMMVFITAQDYIKRIPTESFSSQTRAGRGRKGLSLSEADDLKHCLSARMHDELMFFTTRGVVYTEKVHRVPEGSRQTKGKPLVNVAPLLPEENVTAVIDLSKADADDRYLIMLTLKGVIKKVAAKSFRNVRRSGIIAINLDEEDQLGWVKVCQPHSHLVLATRQGMVIRYTESELRALGRNATGVKSMSLHQGDEIVSFGIFDPAQESETYLLFVTEDGYGKRVLAREFRDQKRGGMGLIGLKFKRPTSRLAGLGVVSPEQEVVIATAQGVLMRQKAGDIPVQSRMATGVRLQQIGEGDFVTSVIPLATGDDAELEGATT
jgi:DNA gyrase subunit A